MLSMSKLLKNSILISSILYSSILFAEDTNQLISDFLNEQLEDNPAIKSSEVKVVEKKPLKQIQGWDAYIVDINVVLKRKDKKLHQKSIFFSNGRYLAGDLTDLKSGNPLKDIIKPQFSEKYYKDENLILGNKNAKHKIVVFSDPLCPFCRIYVPRLIKDIKDKPNEFALYYYNLPLVNLHPASIYVVKAELAAELKEHKRDIYKLYTAIQPENPKKDNYISYRERNPKKILKVFNKVMGTNLTLEDLESPEVKKRLQDDIKVSSDLMVGGTPTVYFDGKFDKTKNMYKKVK